MKLAIVTPVSVIDRTPLTGYHMVLAQLLHRPKYLTFFRNIRQTDPGCVLILDNGAAEGGTVTPGELLAAASDLKPDIIVVPDDIDSASHTLVLAKRFLESSVWAAYSEVHPDVKLMMVPHGYSILLWVDSLRGLLTLDPDVIGIAKAHARLAHSSAIVGRLELVRLVQEHRDLPVHLLGLASNPIELLAIAWSELSTCVLGVDTALPWVLAQRNLALENHGMVQRNALWHSDEEHADFGLTQLALAQHSSMILRAFTEGSIPC